MAQKQKTKRGKASNGNAPRHHRGLKARTPVEFSSPARGSGVPERRNSKYQNQKTKRNAPEHEPSDATRIHRLPQDELHDIAELTLGKRERTDARRHTKERMLAAADEDERVRISSAQITQTPWRKICDLLITAADGTKHSGTAWFISPRTLVTAGHCISVFRPGTPAHGMVRSILVMAARDGETDSAHSRFGWVEVTQGNLRVHPNWANNGDFDFDYGAIILPASAPLGAQTGFFGFGHFLDQDLIQSAPTLSGYPDDVPDGTQWFEVNLIEEVTPTRVSYNIFTSSGQSGCPVFFRNNSRDIACAIHNFGDIPFNRGVRINPQVIAQLNAWKV
jgi:glutamyl endopeptidase